MKKVALIENTGKDFYISRIRFAKFLQKKGYDVTAIIPDDGYNIKIQKDGINTILLGKNIRGRGIINQIKFAFDFYNIFKNNSFDIIHCYRMQPNIIGGFIGGVLNKKVINHITGLGILFTKASLKFKVQRYFISNCYKFNSIFFRTKYIFQNENDVIDLGIRRNYKVIKGSAVNENVFYPKKKHSNSILNEFNKFSDEKVILFVSRLIKSKGLDVLVKSVKYINQTFKVNHKLLIVGWIDQQNIDSHDQIEIDYYDKHDFISFLGERNDISDLINISDICVLPTSYREGTPRFLLEAMVCAKPIITTNNPGCSHLVSHQKPNGFLVDPLNETNLSTAIIKLFNSDLKKFGENSRRLYLEEFSEEIVYNSILDFYNNKTKI